MGNITNYQAGGGMGESRQEKTEIMLESWELWQQWGEVSFQIDTNNMNAILFF